MSRKDDENLTVLSTSLAPIRATNAPFRRAGILTSDIVFFVRAGLECPQSRCLTAMLCPRCRLALKWRHRECGRAPMGITLCHCTAKPSAPYGRQDAMSMGGGPVQAIGGGKTRRHGDLSPGGCATCAVKAGVG